MKIKIILKNIVSIFLALTIAATTFTFNSNKAQAWEQGANGSHEEINKYAVSRFFSAYAGGAKYTNSPIDKNLQFLGNQTTSATLAASGFTIQKSSLTFDQWVTHGGFSADEPEIWACVRHFYDPLSINGVPQLTDHLALHGFVYTTISAKEWAFKEVVNPYGWRKALEYYKQAMEIPDDSKITVIKGMDFRDPDIAVSSAAEARSAYLGKAFRALGETMHMIGDITQPSHVRNDSHPSIDTDPLESTVNKDTVRIVKDSPVEPLFGNAIDSAPNLEAMYEKLATLTNNNFYTDDTIYDKASGVKPRNWENPYPYPQFSDMTLNKGSGPKTYSQGWNGKQVRMVQQTYTSWKLGALWQDYIVPAAFATEQAEVLIPIAIKANAKVINSFFPTLDLTLDVKENKNASTNGDANYKEYSLETQLKHLSEKDVEWQKSNLAIQYSGPAELWGETKGKARKIADLKYKAGVPLNPLTVFVGDEKFQKVDKYQVNNGDNIYVIINAGGRNFKSAKYTIPSAAVKLYINPAKLSGEPDKEYKFTAEAVNPPDKARYSWILNGKKVQENTSVTYTTKFSAVGNYTIVVTLIDAAGKELASASATADIKVASPTPSASATKPTPSTTTATFGPTNCKYFSWRYRVKTISSITDPVKTYTESSTVTLGTTNIAITWSGNTFTFSEKGHTLTGTVSADGSALVKLEEAYVNNYTNSAGSGSYNTSFALSNVPLGRVQLPVNAASTTGFGIDQTGTSVKSYLSKYESKSTSTTSKGTTSSSITSIEMADKIKLVFSESNISTDY